MSSRSWFWHWLPPEGSPPGAPTSSPNGRRNPHALPAPWRWPSAGKNADAATVFATIDKEGGGYTVLASFENAAMLAKAGDRKKAAAAYLRITEASGLSPTFRDLAVLLSVMQETPDDNPKAAIARLAPLTATGAPWRPTALELTAAAQLKLGDKKAALEIYRGLADDLSAPRSLRARAAEMAAALAS